MAAHGHLSPPMTLFHNWPGSPPSDSSVSVRSCSSIGGLSSSSSLASTFSDISQQPSSPQHSTGTKTHAFFASPFATDTQLPSRPDMPPSDLNAISTPTPARSITADFFSTPVRAPTPPKTTTKASSILAAIHPSRIFPSRYTSRNPRDEAEESIVSTTASTRKTKPELLFLDLGYGRAGEEHTSPVLSDTDSSRLVSDGNFTLIPSPHGQHCRDLSSLSSISTSSSSTHSSLALPESTNPHRLPTPPPPSPLSSHALHFPNNSADEPTPRPSHLEPNYTKHDNDADDDEDDAHARVEPAPGCIITSSPPCISHPTSITALFSPKLTVTPPPDTTTFTSAAATTPDRSTVTSPSPPPSLSLEPQTSNTVLHLVRPLGQGAFSSVWLAEDKSRVPLTIRSKKSVRDLRRKASLANLSRRSSVRSGVPHSSNNSIVSLSRKSSLEDKVTALERNDSLRMRRLRLKVRGTRPMGFDTNYLDERHGKMGIGRTEFGVLEPSSSTVISDEPNLGFTSPPLTASNSLSVDVNHGEDGVRRKSSKRGRLVAVKMTPRRAILTGSGRSKTTKREREEEEERTRVGFVREVEVLKVSSFFISSFSWFFSVAICCDFVMIVFALCCWMLWGGSNEGRKGVF